MKSTLAAGAISPAHTESARARPLTEDRDAAARAIVARLDRLPATRHIWSIVFLLSLGGCFEFYDLFMTGYIAPGLIASGLFVKTSTSIFAMNSIAAFVAATFTGLFIGTLGLGFLADRFGRRRIFVVALLAYTAASVLMAFQQSPLGVNVFRLLAGIGLGVEMVTINTYVAELMPKNLRGRAFAITQIVPYCAVPVVALMSWWLVPMHPLGVDGWRWVVLGQPRASRRAASARSSGGSRSRRSTLESDSRAHGWTRGGCRRSTCSNSRRRAMRNHRYESCRIPH